MAPELEVGNEKGAGGARKTWLRKKELAVGNRRLVNDATLG